LAKYIDWGKSSLLSLNVSSQNKSLNNPLNYIIGAIIEVICG
jgi:hypothetical protein